MSDPAPTQLVTSAVVALVRAHLPASSVYDFNVPSTAAYPYSNLMPIPGGSYSGPPLYDPEADSALVFQWDSVGTRRDQAQFRADQINAIMLGRVAGALRWPLDPHLSPLAPGWVECARLPAETPGAPEPYATPGAATIYTVSNRYTVVVTPV